MVNESLARNEVDGVYPLGAPIRRSARSAVYETEVSEGDSVVPAVIRIREVEPSEAEELKERLREAGELAHPNLLKVYAGGSSLLNDVPVFYVVMERADESLEAVLAERALTESETREMLVPVLEVLGYLHKKGYAHSRLRPSNVLAVNDRLKLSADSLVRASDSEAAEDMRALGVLIGQVLTQKMPSANDTLELQEISPPLAEIVRHCLDRDPDSRWTVEQVKARLNGPATAMEEMPRREEHPDPDVAKTEVPKWIYAGLAALILIVSVAAIMRRHSPPPVATPSVARAPITPAQIAEAPHPSVELRRTAQSPIAVTPAANLPDARKASGWSVIVAAYGSRDAAEKRMRDMSKKWPKFDVSVLESHAEKTGFLVVLGRNLSEDQAEALRKRAVGSGLPRDTYIKRVM